MIRKKIDDINTIKNAILGHMKGINRRGIMSLIEHLKNETDYFTAPASGKHHNVFEGGLMLHSWNVAFWMSEKNERMGLGIPEDSVKIAGFFHDICKCNAYIKNGEGYIYNKDKAFWDRGHAKASIAMLKKHIQLSEQEEMMIRYHMGTWGMTPNKEYGTNEMHEAIKKYPEVQIFASTDMEIAQYEKAR